MKHIGICIITTLLLATVISSCGKQKDFVGETSSLTIFNCMTVGHTIFPALTGSPQLSFSNKLKGLKPIQEFSNNLFFKSFGVASGTIPLKIYVYPDSLMPVITKNLELKPKGIYSLFVTGTRAAIDTLFIKDQVPAIPVQDSMIVIRFVNLFKGGIPLSINIKDDITVNAIHTLSYKSITPYMTFKVKRVPGVSAIVYFEIRDAITTDIISTCQYKWYEPSPGNTDKHFLSKPATGVILDYLGTPTCTIIDPVLVQI